MQMLKKTKYFKFITLTAALLLVTGFSLLVYTNYAIQENTRLVNSANLTPEQIWNYEGALQWWTTTYPTILPLASAMIAAGFTGVLGPTLWTKFHSRHALRRFTEKLELASNEEFEIEFE